MYKLSIIIPVYNSEPWIESCIRSIQRQNYANLEIILVDDGSRDSSATICDAYSQKDERIRVCHTKNGGPSKARNIGLKQINGRYFLFADSDDQMLDGALSELSKKLSLNPDLIIYGFKTQNNNGIESATVPSALIMDRNLFCEHYIPWYMDFLINSPWNKLFKSSLLDEETVFPEHISLGEDLEFCNAFICRCDKIISIDKALYLYQQHSGSLTTRYYDGLFEIYKEHYENIVATVKSFDPSWNEEKCCELHSRFAWYIKQAVSMVFVRENKACLADKYKAIRSICRDDFTSECVKHIKIKDIYSFLLKKRWTLGLFLYLFGASLKARIKHD